MPYKPGADSIGVGMFAAISSQEWVLQQVLARYAYRRYDTIRESDSPYMALRLTYRATLLVADILTADHLN